MSKMKSNLRVVKRIVQSVKGYLVWRKVTKFITEKDIVLVLPENNDCINYYSLFYLDDYMEDNKKNNCVLVTNNKKVLSNYSNISNKIIKTIKMNNRKMNNLVQFYCLYQFDERILIGSLSKPNGRNAMKILNKNGITIEDIVAIGVYGLKNLKDQKKLSLSQINSKQIFNIEG